ncbi:hypothetical protein EK21DRAFT_117102 [Setomelanomma holmii]|uniref:Uncharacterized protein n=1 Tax=Setomelanomma holmii TaxID=210430 RepID=A0A9P4LH64_9PLEO|nr:hypothetical protein EK21DRAFT_117102 [Setomelanomma holmii]
MANFQILPTELRLDILEYVVCSLAWLEPPDVEALDLDEWYYPSRVPARQVHPVLWFARRKSPKHLLRSLLCVSKDFKADTDYVWEVLIEPELKPLTSITGVGHAETDEESKDSDEEDEESEDVEVSNTQFGDSPASATEHEKLEAMYLGYIQAEDRRNGDSTSRRHLG